MDYESLSPTQLEILLGLVQPFQCWLDANDQWWIVPEHGPPATGPTFIVALGRVAEQAREGEED